MRRSEFKIGLIILFASICLYNCKKEYFEFENEYLEIYGTWVIRSISGGFSGGGIVPDFDYLEINRKNSFSIFRGNSLISKGRLKIQSQTTEELTIQFIVETAIEPVSLTGSSKRVLLTQDKLTLQDKCMDCYSYAFIRCDYYNNENYIRASKTLDFLEVTKFSIGFNKHYTSIFFVNENVGFLTCYDGSILKTTDSGETWNEININYDLPLYDITFINESIGFAVGGNASCGGTGCTVPGSIVLKTIDGGESWIKQEIYSDKSELHLVKFASDSKGFAIGYGTNLITIDAGITWEPYPTNFRGYVYELQFISENVGFLSGIKGILYKTIDGGASWVDISLDISYQLYTVGFQTEEIGYIGSYKKLMKTTDGGVSWEFMDYAPSGVSSIYFTSENELVVFGGRDYFGGSCNNVWNSNMHFLIDGKWYGDERVSFVLLTFRLNSNIYYSVNGNDELVICKIIN